MGYVCEWAAGQYVYLDNIDHQTRVTLTSSGVGQQQQTSSSVQTGNWTAPPEVVRSPIGIVVKLFTAQGDRFVHIQGNCVSTSSEAPVTSEAQSMPVQLVAKMPASDVPSSAMPSMAPMTPLPPMKMGTMQMDQTAMTMQMGGMRLEMPIARSPDSSTQTNAAEPTTAVGQHNFCSQCGNALQPSDRFCANCGHRLA